MFCNPKDSSGVFLGTPNIKPGLLDDAILQFVPSGAGPVERIGFGQPIVHALRVHLLEPVLAPGRSSMKS